MAQGLTDDLFLVAFTVWLSGLWVCRRDLPFLEALIVTSIRVSIPVVYFAWFYYGTWTFSDDLTYMSRGNPICQHLYRRRGEDALRTAPACRQGDLEATVMFSATVDLPLESGRLECLFES
jgi:hypothetical protein